MDSASPVARCPSFDNGAIFQEGRRFGAESLIRSDGPSLKDNPRRLELCGLPLARWCEGPWLPGLRPTDRRTPFPRGCGAPILLSGEIALARPSADLAPRGHPKGVQTLASPT